MLELQIIRAREFVRLDAGNHFDLPASKLALGALARACSKRGIDQALLDLRAVEAPLVPAFSPGDLVALIQTFQEMGFRQDQRLAVLYTADPHRRARLFAFIGALKGWNIGAFDSFEAALLWLAGEETLDVQSFAGQSVPINPKPDLTP